MNPYHYNVGNLLARALQQWNKKLIKSFEQAGFYDVKPSYGAIFIPLFDQDVLTASQLAEKSQLSKQTVSDYIKELVSKRYLTLKRSDDDKREIKIFLSKKGLQFREAATKILKAMDAETNKALGKKDFGKLQNLLVRYLASDSDTTNH